MILLSPSKVFLCILVLFISCASYSESPAPLSVKWYQPQILRSIKPGYARVRLLGQTESNSSISFTTEKIPFVDKDNKVFKISKLELSKDSVIQVDKTGAFEMDVDLPIALAQIPITIQAPDGRKKNFQLPLQVTEDSAIVIDNASISSSPYSRKQWGVWLGVGANLLVYDQTISELSTDIGYQSFKGPSYFAKFYSVLSPAWAFQSTYNSSPGESTSSDAISVKQGEYNWVFYTAEVTYFPNHWKVSGRFSYLTEFGLQVGLQQHSLPFVFRSSSTDSTEATITTNSATLLSAGATMVIHTARQWFIESFLRYQYPLNSGSLYNLNPELAFDGSVGFVHKLKSNLRIGGFWYGQLHKYNFTEGPDDFTGNAISGSQTLLFSNLELRLGYEFD